MRKKTIVQLTVAAALFGVAGYFLYGHLKEEYARKPRNNVVARRTPPRPSDLNAPARQMRNNILARELMRQALLLARRDDHGLPTRDATLGESPQDAPEPLRGLITEAFVRENEGVQVQLFRDPAMTAAGEPVPNVYPVPATAQRPMLFQVLIPSANRGQIDYFDLLQRAAGFSRGEFAKAIGPTSRPAPPASAPTTAPAPADLEPHLGQMNYISQYAAVRAAHTAIRQSGPTPEMMGVLVRGYANLGRLTEFHWTAAFKAFQARSLLYGQRLIDAAGPSPSPRLAAALRHRAYALALAGLQADALRDLDAADKLTPATADAPYPGWLLALRPFCRYQPGQLANLAADRPADAPLALFLCFLTVERVNSPSVTNGYGQVALTASPDCLRVVDAMSAVSGVGANHVVTEAAPQVFAMSLAKHLPAVPGLPADVRRALDAAVSARFSPEAAAAVPAALVAAGRDDTAAPSWTVLGRLIEETNFVHVQRRAQFMAEMWGVDASDFAAEARPLYRDHPYRLLIDHYALDRSGTLKPGEPVDALLKHLAGQQLTFALAPLLQKLDAAGFIPPDGRSAFKTWQGRFTDSTSADLERQVSARDTGFSTGVLSTLLEALRRTSPHSPTYIARTIDLTPAVDTPQLQTWKNEHGDHPMVAAALGRKYTALKDYPEAEKFLRAYIAKAPDQWAYTMLANNFLAQGDEANWLATFKARLEQPDYGLDHARTNDTIARYYMRQGKWTVARPYADAAAESYAQWALETAAECYDGLGDRDRASAIRAAIAERYGR